MQGRITAQGGYAPPDYARSALALNVLRHPGRLQVGLQSSTRSNRIEADMPRLERIVEKRGSKGEKGGRRKSRLMSEEREKKDPA
eukprot:5753122-Pleurochrysis_carterae.AAC.2